MNVIKTDNLTKEFPGRIAVDHLNFYVQEGEIFGIVGPDGAGKTTTMRMLASILDPTSGSAEVLGYSLKNQAEDIKASIGYMSQRFGLYQDLTVAENIDFYADIYNVSEKEREERQERLLHFSGLKPFKQRLAASLSGGMKQKLGLTCALIHSPRLVLLDEPTNGVDPVSRKDFWNILKELQKQGISILMTTSYLDEAEKCDRIGVMNEGKLLLVGTLDEMRKGSLIEITPENARKDIAFFQERFKHARLFGNKIHLYGEDEHAALEFCKKEGIAYKKMAPTLEDIFIAEVTK